MPRWRHGWSGFRMTGPRMCIMDIFRRYTGHLTASEVYNLARKACPGIGIATVYRTLDFLTQNGFLRKYISPDGTSRYEYVEEGKEHIHFICRVCGRIYNAGLLSEGIKRMLKENIENLEDKGFIVEGIQLGLSGVCNVCRESGLYRSYFQ